MFSGLSATAHIGARGGPMSVEAINSPESLGELDEGPIAKDPAPAPQEEPLLETALAEPPQPAPIIDVEDQPPPELPKLDEPLLAPEKPKEDPAAGVADDPARSESKIQNPKSKIAARPAARSLPSAGSIGHAGNESSSSPRFADNAPIAYPVAAVAARLEGEVLLRLHISAEGRVTAVDIIRSSGHDVLDLAAANSVRSWRAEPARLLGQAVATTAILPVRFRLN